MHEGADCLANGSLIVHDDLEREFETRLVESSTLAFRVAYSVLRHREDAEDVAQESCARAYRCFRQLRNRERFRAWLVRTAWRVALDRQRTDRRRLTRELAAPPASMPETTAELIDARERAARLWRAIDALPGKLRLVIVLASMEGHDTQEVARLLDVPEGTVKSRLFLARKRLKESLLCLANNLRTP